MRRCTRSRSRDLEPARVAHLITIVSEMLTAMGSDYDAHQREFALDTRLNLALAHTFTSQDYIHAQRIRTQAIAGFQNALRDVDAIVTPATAITAPPIRQDAQPNGESDLTQLSEIMRFAPFSNLTGHPAISFPAGYSEEGLPIGLQAIGRPWEEHVLFRLAYAAEQFIRAHPSEGSSFRSYRIPDSTEMFPYLPPYALESTHHSGIVHHPTVSQNFIVRLIWR